jgi:hypothetical protein
VHLVGAAIPAVEVADHAHGIGIGGPDGEVDTGDASDRMQLRAELLVALPVAAFAEQVEVIVGQHRGERIGVVEFANTLRAIVDAKQVGGRSRSMG